MPCVGLLEQSLRRTPSLLSSPSESERIEGYFNLPSSLRSQSRARFPSSIASLRECMLRGAAEISVSTHLNRGDHIDLRSPRGSRKIASAIALKFIG